MRVFQLTAVAAAAFLCGSAFAYTAGDCTAAFPGISGPVPVTVTFDQTKITKIVVGANKETAGIGQKAIEVLPGRMVAAQSALVDGVSGATLTSKAIRSGVQACMKKAGGDPEAKPVAQAQPKAAPGRHPLRHLHHCRKPRLGEYQSD